MFKKKKTNAIKLPLRKMMNFVMILIDDNNFIKIFSTCPPLFI